MSKLKPGMMKCQERWKDGVQKTSGAPVPLFEKPELAKRNGNGCAQGHQ
jgi:hypothetical protein